MSYKINTKIDLLQGHKHTKIVLKNLWTCVLVV